MLFYILFLILIPLILSYIILKLIYTKIFKSQKKVSKILVFLGSVGLIVFYYTPYSYYLEPSFWQFRKVCKLNELPNDEYKFNKILGYFNQNFESLDWDKLNEEALKLSNGRRDYIKGKLEYRAEVATISKKSYDISVDLYANDKGLSKENITYIETYGTWHTNRFYLDGNEGSGVYWNEKRLGCYNIIPLKYDYAERIK